MNPQPNTPASLNEADPWRSLLAYVLQDELHNRLTPRVIDIAYTAFIIAKQPNTEDGGSSDWFNDAKPAVKKAIEKLRTDLAAPAAIDAREQEIMPEPVMLSLFEGGEKTWPHYFDLKVGQRVRTHTGMEGTIAAILPNTKKYHVLRDEKYGGMFGAWEVTPLASRQEAPPASAVPEGCTPADARMLRSANHGLAAENDRLREALQFYADGNHFTMHDANAWDTVSGEPANFYEDEANTATVEDGSAAKMALANNSTPSEALSPATEAQPMDMAQRWNAVVQLAHDLDDAAQHITERQAYDFATKFRVLAGVDGCEAANQAAQPCASQGCGGAVEEAVANVVSCWNRFRWSKETSDAVAALAALYTAPRSLDGATPGGKE